MAIAGKGEPQGGFQITHLKFQIVDDWVGRPGFGQYWNKNPSGTVVFFNI